MSRRAVTTHTVLHLPALMTPRVFPPTPAPIKSPRFDPSRPHQPPTSDHAVPGSILCQFELGPLLVGLGSSDWALPRRNALEACELPERAGGVPGHGDTAGGFPCPHAAVAGGCISSWTVVDIERR